jgi:hypothetical protein
MAQTTDQHLSNLWCQIVKIALLTLMIRFEKSVQDLERVEQRLEALVFRQGPLEEWEQFNDVFVDAKLSGSGEFANTVETADAHFEVLALNFLH